MKQVFINLLLCILFSFVVNKAFAEAKHDLMVFKTPTCGCCQLWIDHLELNGFNTQIRDQQSLENIKNILGIPSNHRSCHTAVSRSGHAFEGHVPAKYISQFLSEKHENAIGLAVPAMPVGSPGMEVGDQFRPYQIRIMYKDGTSKVYATIDDYVEQFD